MGGDRVAGSQPPLSELSLLPPPEFTPAKPGAWAVMAAAGSSPSRGLVCGGGFLPRPAWLVGIQPVQRAALDGALLRRFVCAGELASGSFNGVVVGLDGERLGERSFKAAVANCRSGTA